MSDSAKASTPPAAAPAPSPSAPPAPRPQYKRSARNYLLDRHFQLKYTGMLVGVALVFASGLGILLWRSSGAIVEQSKIAVEQGRETVRLSQETVERGQEVIKQSQKVSQVVAMNIAKEYADSPELAKTFQEEASKDEKKLGEEQRRLEADAKFLTQRASDMEKQAASVQATRDALALLLIVGILVLVGGIGVAGIVFTHRIAGPIFKMKRLLREVGEGKLILKEKLRKGDELQHFFETFATTVDQLRQKQMDEIARVDAILVDLEKDAPAAHGVAELRKLRAEMQDHLGG
jgi:nitrogen fixation/metabolism regulation signal transduction histidine kinase